MRCYSYMSSKALGSLLCNEKLSGRYAYADKDLRNRYEWMRHQMSHRIGPAPDAGAYPIWVWYMWEGKLKCPDARDLSYQRMEDPGGVFRVTLDIPDNLVLLSNFDTWHAILNDSYLYVTDEEFDKENHSREEIVKSWDRIFDISNVEWNKFFGPSVLSIQGTVWEITVGMIVKIEHFHHIKPTEKFLENKKFWDNIDDNSRYNV